MHRDNICYMYVYGAYFTFFNVCCSECVGFCVNVCCIAAVVKNSMLWVCVVDVMDVVFSVCIVRRGAVGARVWEV